MLQMIGNQNAEVLNIWDLGKEIGKLIPGLS